MRQKAKSSGVIFRPHVKTHKTVEGALLQHGGERGPITVSTLAEAEFFADNGFDDITYAVPIAPAKLRRAAEIRRASRLALLVDNREAFLAVEEFAAAQESGFDLYLKVDSGYHRAGVDPADEDSIALAQAMAQSRRNPFRGFLTHAGHSYHVESSAELERIARDEHETLTRFRAATGLESALRSIGSTPTLATRSSFDDCDEVRPGNYIFFDNTQVQLGSCDESDVAISVLASVIGVYPEQRKIMIDAGSLAITREPSHHGNTFGVVCDTRLHPLPLKFTSMSQEHGQLYFEGSDAEWRSLLHDYRIGSRLRILPNHSCITAAMYDVYYVLSAEGEPDAWRPARGW